MQGISLCSGYGGLEMALHIIFGKEYKTVAYCEINPFPVSILKARMKDENFNKVPIYSAMESFPCEEYINKIDIISAGIPCQPYSVAGSKKGDKDDRALWPVFADIVERIKPKTVLLENVPDFLRHAEGIYLRLQELGFNWYPPCFTDAEFWGAPHRRKRVFLLAEHQDSDGYLKRILDSVDNIVKITNSHSVCNREIENSQRTRIRTSGRGIRTLWITDPATKTICAQHSNSNYWSSKSPVCGVDDGSSVRLDQLKLLGNGVVPIMAAGAVKRLIRHGLVKKEVCFQQNRIF